MPETTIMRNIQLALSCVGVRMFRNNTGLFNTADGSRIRTGLCVGSSDLIGLTPRVITADMLGRQVAIFTAIEVKTAKGKLRPEQKAFLSMVKKAGGIAIVARDVDEAIKKIEVGDNGAGF
jgi:hypothetical protein